jgi:transposase
MAGGRFPLGPKVVGYGLDKVTPDHSTVSRTRRLHVLPTHKAVFAWVLQLVSGAGLSGKTVAVDATPLEANAAMRSIVRRDTGGGHQEGKAWAEAAGIARRNAWSRRFRRARRSAPGCGQRAHTPARHRSGNA